MIRRKTATAIAFLLATLAAAPGICRAETRDAQTIYELTDPATGKTGTVRVTATAVISQNMVIEYVTPMNLGTTGIPGGSETLRLIAASRAIGRSADNRSPPPLSASMAVQGMPNQAFAVSIDQVSRGADGPDGPVIATFTHNAGQTPHIGPSGDTEFTIGATLRLARNTASRGYSGTLDVIVSHN
jgi:hypothetical protein